MLVVCLCMCTLLAATAAAMQVRAKSPMAFFNWCRDNINAPKCALHNFDGLRGIIAVDDIAADEVIMEVPLRLCFMRETDDEKWPCDLAMDILAEIAKGPESSWFAYLSALPRAQDFDALLPVHWDAEELEESFSNNDFIFDDDVKLAVENSWAWRDFMWTEAVYRNRRLTDKVGKTTQMGWGGVVESRIKDRIKDGSPGAMVGGNGDGGGRAMCSVQNRRLVELATVADVDKDGEGVGSKNNDASPTTAPSGQKKTKESASLLCSRAEFEYALDVVQTRNCCPRRAGEDTGQGRTPPKVGPLGAPAPTPKKSIHLVVPMFDMLNHDGNADTVISLDEAKGIVRLVTRKTVPKDSQVFLNYHLESQVYSPLKSSASASSSSGSSAGVPDFQMDMAAYALTSYGFIPTLNEVNVLLPLETIRSVLVDASTTIIMGSPRDQMESVTGGENGAQGAQGGSQEAGATGARPGSALAILQALDIQISQPFLVYRDGISVALLGCCRVLAMEEEERQALWGDAMGAGAGVRALQDGVLAGQALSADVVQQLHELLDEEHRKHLELVGSEGQNPSQAARRRYSTLALDVIKDCVEWLDA